MSLVIRHPSSVIRVGTRKSPLALAQAHMVRDALGGQAEIVPFVTSGDRFTGQPLSEIGGKGLFTKEIEEALLAGEIDIAVHSMKDMPTVLPPGLIIGAMPEREDPRDRLVGQGFSGLSDLPQGATFGTSSLRRSAQLLMLRPDITIVPLRGNVQTRLDKIAAGGMQATMLAMAGLNRLGLRSVPGAALAVEEFLPAVAQGAIGIECREDDTNIRELLAGLSHAATEKAVRCEREFLRMLDGSCRTPIAGYAQIEDAAMRLRGLIVAPDGSSHKAVDMTGDADDAETLGRAAAEALLA